VRCLLVIKLTARFSSDYSDSPRQNRSASVISPGTYGGKPARPTAPKPVFTRKDSLGRDQYIAQFTFEGEQSGDLSFKKGDIVEVTKKTDKRDVLLVIDSGLTML
jgi:SH3 domain